MPPSAGPAIVATCQVDELSATAVPNWARGTRLGSNAWPVGIAKARAMPNSTITANTGRADSRPCAANASSSSAQAHSSAKQAARMRRRSRLSARCPAGRISSTNGRNCDRPTSPRSSGSRVTS